MAPTGKFRGLIGHWRDRFAAWFDAPRFSGEFQPDVIEIEDRVPPRLARATLYTLAALIVIGLLWATFSHVDMVVTAPGRMITSSNAVVIQSVETAVVRSIDVRVGQTVKKGDTVATLDPTFAVADVAQVKQRVGSLTAEVERLDAELADRPYARKADDAESDLQANIYEKHTSEYQARVSGFRADLARLDADIKGTQKTREVLRERVESLKKMDAMRQDLYDKKFLSSMALIESRDKLLEVQQSYEDASNKLSQLAYQVQQTQHSFDAFTRAWRQKTLEDLLKARRERDSLQEQFNKAERKNALVYLSAPMDATVLEINKKSVGTVAKEAEPILTLVPSGVPIEAEVQIPADEVGFVRKGDPVRIKVDAFPFQKHGVVEGRLTVIGGDSFIADPSAAGARLMTRAYYPARVEIVRSDLKKVPADTRILPGMTVVAEIKVSQRTVLSYFLYPFIKAFDESIREP
jgi:HlyD family secretion protein